MSANSVSSVAKSSNIKRGIPRKCECGSELVVLTAKTQSNPSRPFFRCASSRDDAHLFKWVEDATFEETEDMLQKLESNEIEMNNIKNVVMELKEEIQGCKIEIRKYKIMNKCFASFLGFLAIIILILYLLVLRNQGYNKFVVGF